MQLAHGDIILTDQGANVLVKWSKTIQNRSDIHAIPIPVLLDSILCPYNAITCLLNHTPGSSNTPLFSIPRSHGPVPLTDSVARRHLHSISTKLHIASPLKFHDFRRSGATWAFHNGVPLQHIMHHGNQIQYGNTSNPHPNFHHQFPPHFNDSYIHDLLSWLFGCPCPFQPHIFPTYFTNSMLNSHGSTPWTLKNCSAIQQVTIYQPGLCPP